MGVSSDISRTHSITGNSLVSLVLTVFPLSLSLHFGWEEDAGMDKECLESRSKEETRKVLGEWEDNMERC